MENIFQKAEDGIKANPTPWIIGGIIVLAIVLYVAYTNSQSGGYTGTNDTGFGNLPTDGSTGSTGTGTSTSTSDSTDPYASQLNYQTALEALQEKQASFTEGLAEKQATFQQGIDTSTAATTLQSAIALGAANTTNALNLLTGQNAAAVSLLNETNAANQTNASAMGAINLTNTKNAFDESLRENTASFDWLYGNSTNGGTDSPSSTGTTTYHKIGWLTIPDKPASGSSPVTGALSGTRWATQYQATNLQNDANESLAETWLKATTQAQTDALYGAAGAQRKASGADTFGSQLSSILGGIANAAKTFTSGGIFGNIFGSGTGGNNGTLNRNPTTSTIPGVIYT